MALSVISNCATNTTNTRRPRLNIFYEIDNFCKAFVRFWQRFLLKQGLVKRIKPCSLCYDNLGEFSYVWISNLDNVLKYPSVVRLK